MHEPKLAQMGEAAVTCEPVVFKPHAPPGFNQDLATLLHPKGLLYSIIFQPFICKATDLNNKMIIY